MKKKKSEIVSNDDKGGRLKSALSYCYRILNYKPYTELEIAQKIGNKFGDDVVDEILEKLKKARLVDDRLYVKLWVESRVNSHPEGIIVMKYRLRQKRIPDEIIEEYFTLNPVDEKEMIKSVIGKKLKHYKGNKNKMYKYLLGKGFNSENISFVLKNFQTAPSSL
ncbi:MAG: hypothetical protein GWP03_05155 [Proteobacteria bacterium]|nr:hypothetical protein [Pseudomonadota bacterium]